MGTTTQKLNNIINSKNKLKNALTNMQEEITSQTTFRQFAEKFDNVYNKLPKVTGEGSSFSLEGTRKGKVINTPEGNTSQESTRGVNQYDHYNYPVNETRSGVTITNNGDGSFTLNGTCTANNTIFEFAQIDKIKELGMNNNLVHTLYYISGTNSKSSSSSANRNVMRLNYDKPNSMIHLEELETQLIISKKQSLYTSGVGWGVNIVASTGDSFDNFTVKYQLEIGDEATPWEPYTGGQPSPSSEYKQPIKVVTGNNKVKIGGKNLLSLNNNVRTVASGVSLIADSIQPNSFRMSGKSVWGNYVFMFNNEKNNTGYTLSARFKSTVATTIGITVYGTDVLQYASSDLTSLGSISGISASANTAYNLNIDFNSGTYQYLVLRFWNNAKNTVLEENTDMLVDNIQLETGSATNYEPYIEPKEFDLDLTGKNIIPTDISEWEVGQYATTGEKTGSSNRIRLKSLIEVSQNQDYYVDLNNELNYRFIIRAYDENQDFLFNIGSIPNKSTFSTENAKYVSVTIYNSAEAIPSDIILNELSSGQIKPFICLDAEDDKTFEPYYNYELAGIREYKDCFFKNEKINPNYNVELDENEWYKLEKNNFVELDGDENPSINTTSTNTTRCYYDYALLPEEAIQNRGLCNRLTYFSNWSQDTEGFYYNNNSRKLIFRMLKTTVGTTKSSVNEWLSNNPTKFYYVKYTPTYTKIPNDITLYEQLEELNKYIGQGGTIVIETESEEENAQLIVKTSALKDWNVESEVV